MTENPTSTPQTDLALARLQRLAQGNGLSPDKIELYGTEEKIYTLEGTLTLIPKCDVETARYPGAAKGGKGRQVFPDAGSVQKAVAQHREKFLEGRNWIESCLQELKTAPGQGWGASGAHITLPDQSAVFSYTNPCPTCRGQRLITCNQCNGRRHMTCAYCHGRRQENCYACNGTGHSLQDSSKLCTVCNGTRLTVCRNCQGSGQTACPACGGRGGTPCPGCNATGQISEDVTVTCGAETVFKINSEGLPSGFRQALSRLGLENLNKGHADIMMLPEATAPEKADATEEEAKAFSKHEIRYEARLPYADLRMNLNGKKAMVTVFGKKAALLGVPNFLDDALQPARDHLTAAAQGQKPLEAALAFRAMDQALQLELGGKAGIRDFRRLYPVGLSQEAMTGILDDMRRAVKRLTLKTRSVIACLWVVVSAGLFTGVFLTPLHSNLTMNRSLPAQCIFDLMLLLLPLGLGWLGLNLATRFVLQRRFKNHAVALQQTIGKTGLAMFGTILILYVAFLTLAPAKPFWLLSLLQSLTHS